jgi:hypothetical protein
VLSFLLSGCSYTSYQPRGKTIWGYGYEDKAVLGAKDVYSVDFWGDNKFFDFYDTWKYVLFRCAEVANEKNYDYFVVISGKNLSIKKQLGMEDYLGPHLEYTIKLLNPPIPPDLTNVYEAKEVLKSFGPFIKR